LGKNQIAVSVAARDNLVGPVVVAIAVANTNFFRKYGILLKDTSTAEKRERAVNLAKKGMTHFYVVTIKPEDQDTLDIVNRAIDKGIIECLNTYQMFWTEDIRIMHPNVESFKANVNKLAPENLKKLGLNPELWKYNTKGKIETLANTIAQHFRDKAEYEIKRTYGDFGSGKEGDQTTEGFIAANPDFPHLRRYATNKKKRVKYLCNKCDGKVVGDTWYCNECGCYDVRKI